MLTSLSLPPFNYFLLNFITFTLFLLFLIKKLEKNKKKFIFFVYGWLFGFGYFATNLYWISISLTFDKNFEFLIPFTIILIPAFIAIFYGLSSYLFYIFKQKNTVSSVLLFALIFGSLEFLRGSIFTGFPWNLIANSFSNQLEILSITSIVGTYGFNLLCISLFTCPTLFILKKSKTETGLLIFFLIIFISFYKYGLLYKEKFNEKAVKHFDYKIRVVGSNISLNRFYKNSDTFSVIQDLIDISKPKIGEKTIFVWPEGILPSIQQEDLFQYKSLFKKYFDENHLLVIGTTSKSRKNGSMNYFNSLTIYNNELIILHNYNKINLVPFGEFLPLENILSKLGLRSLTNNYQSFSKGDQRNVFEIKQQNFFLKVLPLICYEIIYSGKLFNNSEFDLIINISEDGWFGQSVGPIQHFSHSILRAIESGKYIVRSSNNGITAVVNPLGIVEKRVNYGKSGYVDFELYRKIQPTIFSKYGNKIFGLLILLYIFLIFSFNKIKNEQS